MERGVRRGSQRDSQRGVQRVHKGVGTVCQSRGNCPEDLLYCIPLGENRVHNRVECEPQKIIILNPGNLKLKQLFTAWALHPLCPQQIQVTVCKFVVGVVTALLGEEYSLVVSLLY